MAIGDVITILRDGKFRAEARVSDIDVPWIVREMLGSDPVSNFLELSHVRRAGSRSGTYYLRQCRWQCGGQRRHL